MLVVMIDSGQSTTEVLVKHMQFKQEWSLEFEVLDFQSECCLP